MPKTALAIACVLALSGCATQSRLPTLTPLWSTPGFANPESAIPDATGEFLYVSNVAGEGDARDGNGFISRVSLDGAILEREWATGLDAPKGLALAGARLFVSDVTALVEIDAGTGRTVARHAVEGAGFLNDVAVTADGTVLVSDSAKARIHAWRDGRMQLWLEHDLLRSINGLLPERERLIVTTMQGRLLAVDWNTRAITPLAEGLGNADGVVALRDGTYLVGEWPGRLFHVAGDGASTVLLDQREAKHYLNDFILLGDRLIVPNWEPSTVSAYRLQR
ncbi:SMP-30/gluconolactonase/LRE family protein [Lysobacter koreensis]|uniref:SMP-30/gluconolactonase/LRE family protein n=1 Tax=Lysobacter koreensis TaxID=266122 RepID=A0ABW2YN21_9GAMM